VTDADLEWADYAFVSAMGVQQESATAIIARCQAAGVRVVAGGSLFTAEPERFPQVDHLVLGEGELTLPPFLSDLAQGHPQRVYRPTGYADLARSPTPRWDLLDLASYASMNVQFSRGCAFDCEFCNVTALLGHRPRTKTGAQIVTELLALYARGWHRDVFFVDDNLISNRRALRDDLLPALIEWRRRHPGIQFNTQASINLADDPRLMEQLVRAGFTTVFVGIETPNQDSLAECGKRHNLGRDMIADVKRLQRAGLQVQGGFILGFDSDTPAVFERLTEFIRTAGIATAMVGLLQALPGTRLHQRMVQEGRLLNSGNGDNADGQTNLVPGMGLEVARRGYHEVLARLYAPRAYYQRIRTFLREYRVPRLEAPLELAVIWGNLRSFVASVTLLGIIGRERFEYWKLLVWTLSHRPRALRIAITLAIYGHHFRRTAEGHAA